MKSDNNVSPGIGLDGVYRDPWGNPYIISLDLDMNGTTVDGFYGRLIETKVRTLPVNANYPVEIAASVAVWSLGPDASADPAPNTTKLSDPTDPKQILKAGANADNVLSWQP